ncbi:MAG: NTP transferase domain-containing protein [Actinobacteria bacterium]|nr:NTP transferase domain-containing protein [Actinomycetota bacterium]
MSPPRAGGGPLLCLMAAGLGRRFGGLKPLAEVGPAGEALMDLTVRDAAAAGFAAVVAVVRAEVEVAIAGHLRERSPLPVRVARQDALGPARAVPWGTAHAVASAATLLDAPFAVANADDLYGAEAIGALGGWLRSDRCRPGRAALVTYRLDSTLPPSGPVSRAPCTIRDGLVVEVAERAGIERTAGGIRSHDGPLDPDAPVSMNLWGFDPSFAATLGDDFARFAAHHPEPSGEEEHRLPDVVGALVAAGRLEVDALPTASRWLGITRAEDVAAVRAALANP